MSGADGGAVLSVRLPMCPDAELSPNHRGHWRRKADAVKRLRQVAYYMACQAMWAQDWRTATEPVTARATIGWAKGRKRMDQTNLADMLKPVWDGFQDAEIYVNDKQVTVTDIAQERDKDGIGYVVIELVAMAGPTRDDAEARGERAMGLVDGGLFGNDDPAHRYPWEDDPSLLRPKRDAGA